MKRKPSKSKIKHHKDNYVVVTFAEDIEQAREYEALIKSDSIPVKIHENEESSRNSNNFIILVPEEYIDEAHVIIESQNAYEDFYEFALEDEDDSFGDEYFDEDF